SRRLIACGFALAISVQPQNVILVTSSAASPSPPPRFAPPPPAKSAALSPRSPTPDIQRRHGRFAVSYLPPCKLLGTYLHRSADRTGFSRGEPGPAEAPRSSSSKPHRHAPSFSYSLALPRPILFPPIPKKKRPPGAGFGSAAATVAKPRASCKYSRRAHSAAG